MQTDGLSMRELKHHLKQVLKNSGAMKDVKATLRSDFCKILSTPAPIHKDLTYRETLLLSSIYHHLKEKAYLHSLSVFQVESGLDTNVIVKPDVIQEALSLHDYNHKENSILDAIFDQIHSRSRKTLMSTSIQTDPPSQSIRESLNYQLLQLRNEYLQKREMEAVNPVLSMEERMIVFERECEARLRREFEKQLEHMRDVDISRVRLEESLKSRQELDSLRRDLEADYKRRLEAHLAREELANKTALDRERTMQQAQYEFRQRMQKEIDELRSREAAAVKKYELESKGLSLLELRVKESVAILEAREREIFRRERETDLLVKEYQERARIEARNHLQDELDAVLRERSLVRLDRQRVDEDKAAHSALVEELSACRAELRQARGAIDLKVFEIEEWKQKYCDLEVSYNQQVAIKEDMLVSEKKAAESAKSAMAPLLEVTQSILRAPH